MCLQYILLNSLENSNILFEKFAKIYQISILFIQMFLDSLKMTISHRLVKKLFYPYVSLVFYNILHHSFYRYFKLVFNNKTYKGFVKNSN